MMRSRSHDRWVDGTVPVSSVRLPGDGGVKSAPLEQLRCTLLLNPAWYAEWLPGCLCVKRGEKRERVNL